MTEQTVPAHFKGKEKRIQLCSVVLSWLQLYFSWPEHTISLACLPSAQIRVMFPITLDVHHHHPFFNSEKNTLWSGK